MEANDDLVARVKARDTEALAGLIDAERNRLIGFTKSIMSEKLLSMVEPDDLIQEVAAAALAGFETAPLDRYEPIQWLQELCRRRVVDAHRFHFGAARRDAGRQQSMHGAADDGAGGFEAFLAASITSPSAVFSRDVRVQRMHEAVGDLSDEARTAIHMRYAEGLPTKEIAAKLGKTDVAIRVLLSRSVRVLEQQLEDVRPTER
ncbi:RNA polymerase sigma factor [Botrimarina colliarenosi]|uniref:RNA polymerase sigma factor n=1 Tax=Botrimarina colliarenosi TaxID=2528001 RepID=A0A5C6AFH7_9BACT|nr:sigma-70 family RNA polymerase sigma factor [Botrimarina colliarenosi]TWT98177.1 RNA polymerase sigma factor [Botrimarina colliarenosi]